jgi:prepilin-type N-terminal cleavage/methylation domain-containing protein
MCIQNTGKQTIKKLKGFTLIELIVTVLIIGITFAVGVPGLQSLLGNVSVSSNADKLATSLAYARGEAVARVTDVAVEMVGSPATGWNVFLDTNADCAQVAGEEILRVVNITADNVTFTPVTCVRFNELGEADAAANYTFTSDTASATDVIVSVSATGYVRVN